MEVFKKNVPAEARILDVGCGYGRTLHELYEAGYTALSGIDISEKMIARGRRQYPQLDLKQYEGVVFRHHSRERIDHLTSSFTPVRFDSLIYTTMNGHRSQGLYYLGRCGKDTEGNR